MSITDHRVYKWGVQRAKTARLLKEALAATDKAIAEKDTTKAGKLLEVVNKLKEQHAELERLIKEDPGEDASDE